MYEELIKLALENGAAKAEIISVDQIITSAEFREACRQNVCGLWGKCWMCPPDVGDIEPLMAEIHIKALTYCIRLKLVHRYHLRSFRRNTPARIPCLRI